MRKKNSIILSVREVKRKKLEILKPKRPRHKNETIDILRTLFCFNGL